jgi:pimeloyl-ACP methyl ester carboxylesterase
MSIKQISYHTKDGKYSISGARHVDTDFGNIAVHDSGGDSQALVLLHGWGVDSLINWGRVFEDLSNTYRVLAVDLPGHGASTSKKSFEIKDAAAAIHEVLIQSDVKSPILCGYSLGGAVCQELRGACGARSVVYIATAARFSTVANKPISAAGDLLRLSGAILPSRVVEPKGDTNEKVHIAKVSSANPKVLGEALRSIAKHDARDLVSKEPGKSVCILTSEDHVVRLDLQEELAELSKAETIVVKTGHDLCLKPRFKEALAEAINMSIYPNR